MTFADWWKDQFVGNFDGTMTEREVAAVYAERAWNEGRHDLCDHPCSDGRPDGKWKCVDCGLVFE